MKLVTRAQMNQMDQDATLQYYISGLILMEHAGNGVYVDLMKKYSKTQRFCFVCGSGNNGGDGFVIARLLFQKGYDVSIYFVGDEEKLTLEARLNYNIIEAMAINRVDSVEGFDIIVDCLFGTGLKREMKQPYINVIESINESKATIISIDIPSGLNSDNGQVYGCAVKAHVTYTMQCPKIGMYIHPGRMHCGEIHCVDIHMPQSLIDDCKSTTYTIEKDMVKTMLPKRSVHSNKGTYGKVLCIGGSDAMSGAISLASKSALKAGCGLLTCAIPKSIHNIVATNVLESMQLLVSEKDGFMDEQAAATIEAKLASFTTLLIGCGIGRTPAISKVMEVVLQSNVPVVVDADGLVALKPHLQKYKDRKDIILTPHLKEFSDLIDVELSDVQKDVMHYIDIFTTKYPNYTLVVKSDTTIIAQQDKRYINVFGNNGLAVGGSGDVLAGMITGFYAQNKNALEAAIVGVFLHAYSADMLLAKKTVYNIIPSDIIETLETVMKAL